MTMTVAAQINLVMLASEIFTEFYFPPHHIQSAHYLFFGLDGFNAPVPWIRTAVVLKVGATIIMTIHPLRQKRGWLLGACLTLFVAVWIEKGLGLVVPGFIPSPLRCPLPRSLRPEGSSSAGPPIARSSRSTPGPVSPYGRCA
jgi:hypothetical protein